MPYCKTFILGSWAGGVGSDKCCSLSASSPTIPVPYLLAAGPSRSPGRASPLNLPLFGGGICRLKVTWKSRESPRRLGTLGHRSPPSIPPSDPGHSLPLLGPQFPHLQNRGILCPPPLKHCCWLLLKTHRPSSPVTDPHPGILSPPAHWKPDFSCSDVLMCVLTLAPPACPLVSSPLCASILGRAHGAAMVASGSGGVELPVASQSEHCTEATGPFFVPSHRPLLCPQPPLLPLAVPCLPPSCLMCLGRPCVETASLPFLLLCTSGQKPQLLPIQMTWG